MGTDRRFHRARHDDGRCRSRSRGRRAPARRQVVHTVSADRPPVADLPVSNMSTTHIATLLTRIRNRQARVGVIGLGYVGLPLAVEFARAGFDVTGFDVDASKIAEINAGRSYIPDVPTDELAEAVTAGRLRATTDVTKLSEMDIADIRSEERRVGKEW